MLYFIIFAIFLSSIIYISVKMLKSTLYKTYKINSRHVHQQMSQSCWRTEKKLMSTHIRILLRIIRQYITKIKYYSKYSFEKICPFF